MLRLARQRANNGSNLTEVSKAIAVELGRSVEAIRYTIKNFDRAHPDHAVFPDATGSLDATSKQQILMAFQEGKPVDLIAKRFGRTRSSMYRVINEVRAKSLIQEPVDYIHNAEFENPVMEKIILGPMPDEEAFFAKMQSMRPPKEVDAQMAYLYERPILSREQEAHAFRKMNFLKHQLHTFKQSIDPARTRVQDLQKIEDLQEKIKDARDLLIECNQRLVHSEATRHINSGLPLDELKSDANLSVMKASRSSTTVAASSSAPMRLGRSARTSPAASRTRTPDVRAISPAPMNSSTAKRTSAPTKGKSWLLLMRRVLGSIGCWNISTHGPAM